MLRIQAIRQRRRQRGVESPATAVPTSPPDLGDTDDLLDRIAALLKEEK